MLLMPKKLKSGGPKLSEADIKDIERGIGYKLPNDYVEFLLTYNGGRTAEENEFFPCQYAPGQRGLWVQDFRCTEDSEYPQGALLVLYVDMSQFWGRKDMLPIAVDPSGNEVCIRLSRWRYGRIYLWDHEHAGNESGFFEIAKDFASFFNALQPMPPYTD